MKEYIVLYENKYAIIPEDYNKEKLKTFPQKQQLRWLLKL